MNTLLLKAHALALQVPLYRLPTTGATPKTDERGLSQSTENAILLAGAVAIAGIIITVITAYVRSHLPS
ncbi:MAG: hypothetical protein LBH11_04330 [Propionibacteriaceae bacterium]|nr:hypothetical protein [Propionibacteriaceae bacterium]